MKALSAHKLGIASLLFICACAAVFKIEYIHLTGNSDYDSYIATAQVFGGGTAELYPQRILKPLAPLIVTALSPLAGYPAAFILEVVFFYFAFTLTLYSLALIFFEDGWLAWIAALLGALSYPILRYGVDLYTETGAQFLYVLSLSFTLLYIKMPSRRWLVANALALGAGLIWKEYSVIAGVIFGLVLLSERAHWRAKAMHLGLLALLSLLPTLLVQIWVYLAFHYSYLDWYVVGGVSGFATQFTLHNLIKSTAALLGLAWLLVPFGLWRWETLSKAQSRFLLFALPIPFLVLLWGFVSSRLFYVIAPAFILLAVFGMSKWPRWAQIMALVIVTAANLLWLFIATR